MSETSTGEDQKAEVNASAGGGNKVILIVIIFFVILLAAAGAFLFLTPAGKKLMGHSEEKKDDITKIAEEEKIDPKTLVFTELPEVLVNLRSKDGNGGFLKATFIIESVSEKLGEKIDKLKPQIVDQFQIFLREMDMNDLRGSAGLQRVRQELISRVDNITAPEKIRNVLIKEFILQ